VGADIVTQREIDVVKRWPMPMGSSQKRGRMRPILKSLAARRDGRIRDDRGSLAGLQLAVRCPIRCFGENESEKQNEDRRH
jgi:hypothetical protein